MPVFNRLVVCVQKIQNAINQSALAAGVDSTGFLAAPDPPAAINVKASSGLVHVTLTDNSARSRNLHYFLEADTDPSFPAPHIVHMGVSRGTFLSLPALNDASGAQSWYFRAYSMNPGSQQRSPHQVFGGATNPTAVSVGGSVSLTPLPSTGSGTASSSGQEAGTGYGTAQFSKATL